MKSIEYWFTGDQHFDHNAIRNHCNRPFKTVDEMNSVIIEKHNEVVKPYDVVVHVGDFTMHVSHKNVQQNFISKLHGNHIFIKGNHDYWLPNSLGRYMYRKKVGGVMITASHYALRTWPFGWNLHGHSHGNLPPYPFQFDVGVDNNDFYPISFGELCDILINRKGDKAIEYWEKVQAQYDTGVVSVLSQYGEDRPDNERFRLPSVQAAVDENGEQEEPESGGQIEMP